MSTKSITELTPKELYEMHLDCPINNGADINSDVMLENLFDDGQCLKGKIGGKQVVLGFIGGIPAKCEYELGQNYLRICALCKKKEGNYDSWNKILPGRLADEQVFPKHSQWHDGYFLVEFYYRPEYAEKYNS